MKLPRMRNVAVQALVSIVAHATLACAVLAQRPMIVEPPPLQGYVGYRAPRAPDIDGRLERRTPCTRKEPVPVM